MNLVAIREILVKDMQETIKNRFVFMSILILPIIILAENIFVVSQILGSSNAMYQLEQIVPQTSMLVLFIPCIVTTLLASTSIVIEKNNRSLEPLLATPITDGELLLGKCLASFTPAVLLSYITYTLLIVAVDSLTLHLLGYSLLPTPGLVYQLILIPILCLIGTFISLLVSTKIKDVRAAQQVSILAVLPALAFTAIFISVYATNFPLQIVGTILLLFLTSGLAWFTVKRFNRESILVSWS